MDKVSEDDSDCPAISLIDLECMEVFFINGTMAPITTMIDVDGDETSDVGLAWKIVAGPVPDSGKWIVAEVSNSDRESCGIPPVPTAVVVDTQRNCVTFDNGEVLAVATWLNSAGHRCAPDDATHLRTATNQDGYGCQVDLTPRPDLRVI